MTRKEKIAKRKELFSTKAYLYKKAQKRAVKLQYRGAKRNGTLPEVQEHQHGPDCNHEPEELEVVVEGEST